MAKLHELLAVQSNLRGQAEKLRADLQNTFTKKENHFVERTVTFKSLQEGVADKVESQLGMQTTVIKELAWIAPKLAEAMDIAYQIDLANLTAKADVVLGDKALLKDIPATQLLQLEKRLIEVQALINDIPTLDPSKGFKVDLAMSAAGDVYRAADGIKNPTKKEFRFVVMAPPTDKHPAQIKELMEDVPTGTQVTVEHSSALTVSQKATMLDRLEELKRAVSKARARANEVDVDVRTNKIGETLLNYVFKG